MEAQEFVPKVYEKWNTFAKQHGLIEMQRTALRDEQIMRRIASGEIDLDAVMEKIPNSDWLMGRVPGKNFRVSLKYILEGDHAVEILEGLHDNKSDESEADRDAEAVAKILEERRQARESQ